jgi:hypothetical protein
MELICSVSLIAKTIGILEDVDDDEHEDDSSNSEFRLKHGGMTRHGVAKCSLSILLVFPSRRVL